MRPTEQEPSIYVIRPLYNKVCLFELNCKIFYQLLFFGIAKYSVCIIECLWSKQRFACTSVKPILAFGKLKTFSSEKDFSFDQLKGFNRERVTLFKFNSMV